MLPRVVLGVMAISFQFGWCELGTVSEFMEASASMTPFYLLDKSRLTLEEIFLRVHVRIVSNDVEGRPASHHLKHQHAQSPPVHAEAWETQTQHSARLSLLAEAPGGK